MEGFRATASCCVGALYRGMEASTSNKWNTLSALSSSNRGGNSIDLVGTDSVHIGLACSCTPMGPVLSLVLAVLATYSGFEWLVASLLHPSQEPLLLRTLNNDLQKV